MTRDSQGGDESSEVHFVADLDERKNAQDAITQACYETGCGGPPEPPITTFAIGEESPGDW
ncbi:hypothetical protein BRC83_04695 [Halobacteriales archaeon QS_1_68_17]|nr:MAG: hypothetical protein BRC83_04695 [Halobacteriales archaeon QS_1_68_17]